MKKHVTVTPIATVLEGFQSTKPRKENITKLYSFIKQTKTNEIKN
jgi:hypothetical protein